MDNKVLWLSRHTMTEAQVLDLKRIYGEIEVVQHSENVANGKEVLNLISTINPDVVAVVLPPSILGEVVNSTKLPVIRAIANRVETGKEILNPATGKMEKEFMFQHVAWERIVKIEIVTERL